MILAALQVMLFGMLGIFVVMGLIILATKILERFAGGKKDKAKK